jgi:hypothetical protein
MIAGLVMTTEAIGLELVNRNEMQLLEESVR